VPNHVRTLLDIGADEILYVLDRAEQLKALRGKPAHPQSLLGRSIAVVFEKASTRTRISFDVGIKELGGHPVVLLSKDTQLERGESVEDTARMLSGYVHGIVYRTFGHDRIERMAANASVPVINGLSDKFHPCQLLADLMTIRECSANGKLEGVRVAWIGDGNNMANSWINAAAMLGFDLTLACPESFEPDCDILDAARKEGAVVLVVHDPYEAARGSIAVNTDVWASMGQEAEAEKRKRAFAAYMVDDALMAAADPSAVFMHCLPAHRGEEVTEEVLEGKRSIVWEQALNRLYIQEAILDFLLQQGKETS